MAKQFSKLSIERLGLGAARYANATLAAGRHLLLSPFLNRKAANRFCFGVQSLNDEITYDCPLIPQVDAHELFPGIEEEIIEIGQVLPWEGSSISAFEVVNLAAIIRHLKPQRAFEIGTSKGVTAYNLALNLPEGGELLTLDLPPATEANPVISTKFDVTASDTKMIFADRVNRRFLGTPVESRITQLYGDSAAFDYTPYAKSCDVVFVDGSHAYEYVKSDTDSALRIVKPGGWIIWHDYNDGFFWPEVRRYLKEVSSTMKIHRIKGTMFAISQAVK
jgi:predicted O-methyltransferase YrrM